MLKHGTVDGWRAGCRDTCCVRAYNRMSSNRYNLRVADGYKAEWGDPQEVSDRIEILVKEYNYTHESIAKRTGLIRDTITRLKNKKTRRVRKVNYDKIMSVPLRHDTDRHNDEGYISSVGASRRIQAMQIRGFTLRKISELTGLEDKLLWLVRDGLQPTVKVKTHVKIQEGFRSSLLLPDPEKEHASRVRREAARKKYLPFGVWNDIDDPDETPEVSKNPEFDNVIKRMRSIRARGFLVVEMEKRSGISKGNISKMTQGNYHTCKVKTMEKLQEMCDYFESLPDPQGSEHDEARRSAASKGWRNLLESR